MDAASNAPDYAKELSAELRVRSDMRTQGGGIVGMSDLTFGMLARVTLGTRERQR